MPPEQQLVTDASDLTDADKQILDELRTGARTKKAIVDATGLHRNTVGNRLDVLEAGDLINCIHDTTALYELVNDPRTDNVDTTDAVDVEELRDALEDARDAYENVNGDGVEDALDRMEAILDAE